MLPQHYVSYDGHDHDQICHWTKQWPSYIQNIHIKVHLDTIIIGEEMVSLCLILASVCRPNGWQGT